MPRQPSEYRATHAAADRLEPKLARAVYRGTQKLRDRLSINALAVAIAAKDVKRAMTLLGLESIEEALAPTADVVRGAVLRGGRIGAAQVNEALA